MGQKTLGVLYGCVVPDDLDLEEEVLDKWEKSKANRKLGVQSEVEGDRHLVGFWVGIGGDEKGVWDLSSECIPLTVIEKSKEAKHAIQSWKKFHQWCKEHGVNLPTPTFWLTPTEIA